jgi:hypothetical protein
MGNLKISGNTTEINEWNISDIIDDYVNTCKEIHDKETMGSQTSKAGMTYWEIARLNDWELAMEYDNKRI